MEKHVEIKLDDCFDEEIANLSLFFSPAADAVACTAPQKAKKKCHSNDKQAYIHSIMCILFRYIEIL